MGRADILHAMPAESSHVFQNGCELFQGCLIDAFIVGQYSEVEAHSLIRAIVEPLPIRGPWATSLCVHTDLAPNWQVGANTILEQSFTRIRLGGTSPVLRTSCVLFSLFGIP